MYKSLLALLAVGCLVPVSSPAQGLQRRASMVGGGNANGGKCTVEVVVDGAADVQIRGDSGIIRNLSGGQPQWRRFECTGPLPSNPADFRFQGVDGRGRQQLVADPRNGGVAVVRIEDPEGGSEGYTFDLMWSGGGGFGAGGLGGDRYPSSRDGYNRGPRDDRRMGGGSFGMDQAVNICRDEVRQRAAQRFGNAGIDMRETRVDDNPGRRDAVIGTFAVRNFNREEVYQYTCSVDFDRGRVRSVQIDPLDGGGRYSSGSADRQSGMRDAVDSCRSAVESRMRERGYQGVRFGSVNVDDRPGRNDQVIGSATADRGRGWERFDFNCRVDLNRGNVRSVDVFPR